MKKLTVALSVVAVTVMMAGMADAAEIYNKDGNKLDLYGKVDGLHYFSKDKGDDGDQTYVRFGFKGETQINDQLTGYGQWEYNIQANHDEDNGTKGNATRLAFAGLKFADFGSIDYGRNNGVIYDIGAWTDVLPEFGNDTYEGADNFMTGRANGLLTYHNTDFFGLVDGLNFNLQYQGKNGGDGESNNGKGREAKSQNGDGYGMSVTWESDAGFGVGAAYGSSHRTKAQRSGDAPGNADGKRAEVWTTGLKYDANNIYLAATYAQTRNMQWVDINKDPASKLYNAAVCGDVTTTDKEGNTPDCGLFTRKTENYEIVAQYMFDFGLQPSVAYLQSKAKDTGKYGNVDLVKYVDVGATYNFNKNMSAYIDYKINLLKDNNPAGLSTDNLVATGLVYEF
ncbi:porin OmpC [Salmonella enterica]|nr:porin OmpC [Salmonella enterica]ECD6766399.1 porin OmpC [Salmonella enterica subsp. enterica serovar Newport]EEJ3966898.1 porin OmpC [Salmonella enterica subsp. enterica serovar Gatuni]EHC5870354.1 porin OmpC [Salmonella enterica subsp. enterica serovar Eastbourne]EHE0999600.1 porin OmpC [Salmonella enterica subsp. enterica serovar 4,[5],12:i:-]EHM9825691.1 porin OmpC [Salmonella enterica subsp. enterica serovar Infantis]EJL3976943.1 porin OmpC [Salmonella enterica subsp. enterica serovar 